MLLTVFNVILNCAILKLELIVLVILVVSETNWVSGDILVDSFNFLEIATLIRDKLVVYKRARYFWVLFFKELSHEWVFVSDFLSCFFKWSRWKLLTFKLLWKLGCEPFNICCFMLFFILYLRQVPA